MALRLKSLTLKRFRSVISSRLTFDNPTFLVGRNGAGKSNIVDALNFLSEVASNPLDVVFDKRGGIESVRNKVSGPGYPPNLGLAVEFQGVVEPRSITLPSELQIDTPGDASGMYSFEIKASKDAGFEVVRERCVVRDGSEFHWYDKRGGKVESSITYLTTDFWTTMPPNYLMLPWTGAVPIFRPVQQMLSQIQSFAIDPSQMRRLQDPDQGLQLRADGGNAGSVLTHMKRYNPGAVAQLCSTLAQITPNTSNIRPIKHGKQTTLEFEQQWGTKTLKFEAYSASDGTLRALGILMGLLQATASSLVIIEEPESSLHPAALEVLLQLIESASATSQVLVTTHSADLLDAKWIRPENLRLLVWDGGSEIHDLPPRATQAIKSHLMTAGELMRADALDEPFAGAESIASELTLFPDIR
jgi:predicted ATPase